MKKLDLEKLYKENYKEVYWTCISFLGNESDAEDVTQNTFIKAAQSWDTLEDETKAPAWLKKIAANKCLDLLKSRRTVSFDAALENDELNEEENLVDDNFLPDEYAVNKEKRKIVMQIIKDNLSEDQFRTILMFYFDEMSMKDISQSMGVPEGTIKSRLNASKRKIKEGVEKYERENKDKLFMAVPFLVLFFKEQAKAGVTMIPPMSSSLQGFLSSQTLMKEGNKIMMKKLMITIGSIVAAGTIGTAAYVIGSNNENADNEDNNIVNESVSEDIIDDTLIASENESNNTVSSNEYDMSDWSDEDIMSAINTSLFNEFEADDSYFIFPENGSYLDDFECPYDYDMAGIKVEMCRKMVEYSDYDEDVVFSDDDSVMNDLLYTDVVTPLLTEMWWTTEVSDGYVTISYSPVDCTINNLSFYYMTEGVGLMDDPEEALHLLDNDEYNNAVQYLVEQGKTGFMWLFTQPQQIGSSVTYPLENGFISFENYDDLIRRMTGLADSSN